MDHRTDKYQPLTKTEVAVTIADLYPDLSFEKQQEAAYYLGRYIEIVRRVFERTQNLTKKGEPPSMRMPEV